MGKLTLGGYALCTPTYVYIILSIITFILLVASEINGAQIMWFIVKVLIWVFLLNLMCANGLIPLAWFFVLLPFIIIFILLINLIELLNKHLMPQMPQIPQVQQIHQAPQAPQVPQVPQIHH